MNVYGRFILSNSGSTEYKCNDGHAAIILLQQRVVWHRLIMMNCDNIRVRSALLYPSTCILLETVTETV